MTDPKIEQLSALMDGDLDGNTASQYVNNLDRETWRRYHIISDVIHRRPTYPTNSDLSLKISALIQNEPVILAPVTKLPPTYLKPVAGFAVAASVAALAIFGVQLYQSDTINQAQTPLASVQTEQPLVRQISASAPQPVIQPVVQRNASARPVQLQVQSNAKINRYMMHHNEYQSNAGMQGVMPHVRLVTIDSNE